MTLSIVVAMTRDGVIGDKGRMPWHISEETEHFKNLTMGGTVIMGKSTWLSIPEKYRPLSGRVNIIVSSSLDDQEGATVCATVSYAMVKAAHIGKGETFCMGGAKLYGAMLPMADTLHISWIDGSYRGDAHFPDVDWSQWELKQTLRHTEFTYERYLRK